MMVTSSCAKESWYEGMQGIYFIWRLQLECGEKAFMRKY